MEFWLNSSANGHVINLILPKYRNIISCKIYIVCRFSFKLSENAEYMMPNMLKGIRLPFTIFLAINGRKTCLKMAQKWLPCHKNGHSLVIFNRILTNLVSKMIYSSRRIEWWKEIKAISFRLDFKILGLNLGVAGRKKPCNPWFLVKIDFFFRYIPTYHI